MGSLVLAALVITLEPARLPEQSPAVTARVHISDDASPPARKIHLWSSAGTISEALNLGGGKWEAIYSAPAAGRPQYAVVAAWDEEGGRATAITVPLEGRTEFPAETEPGAQVVVQVGGHRASGHADANGQAHVTTMVAPEARTARISAVDAAGNTTLEEVKLDNAPGGVWLVVPPEIDEGAEARVFAFATGGAAIKLRVTNKGGELQIQQDDPGVLVATVKAHDNVKLSATAEPGHAGAELRYHPKPPPPPPPPPPLPPPPPPPPLPPPRLVQPRWDLGATVSARFSGDFAGVGVAVEYRRRVRGRWHLGLDVLGSYADGNAQSNDVSAGAVGARLVGELRLAVAPLVALFFEGAAGAVFAYEQRTPTVGSARNFSDGAPSLALGAGLVARAGRGLFVLRLEFAWTPLIRLGLANLDGGALSVGYRYGRW